MNTTQARQGFTFYHQTLNHSPKTIAWYNGLLRDFENWLLQKHQTESLPVDAVTRDDVREYIVWLQNKDSVFEHHRCHKPEQRQLSPTSISAYVRAISAFGHWLMAEGIISHNIMEGVRRPKTPQAVKPGFDASEITKLLNACASNDDPLAVRNRAIIMVLFDSGLRANELCSMTMEQLDPEYRRALVLGKGMKERYVAFGVKTRQALWTYLHVHRPEPKEANAVFLTKFARPFDPTDLAHLLKKLGDKAGVSHVNPHRFRHAFCRTFLRNGGDLVSLQQLCGHSSLTTLRGYLQLDSEDLQRTHARVSPMDRLGIR